MTDDSVDRDALTNKAYVSLMATDKATHMTLYSVTAELHDKITNAETLMNTVKSTAKELLKEAMERQIENPGTPTY